MLPKPRLQKLRLQKPRVLRSGKAVHIRICLGRKKEFREHRNDQRSASLEDQCPDPIRSFAQEVSTSAKLNATALKKVTGSLLGYAYVIASVTTNDFKSKPLDLGGAGRALSFPLRIGLCVLREIFWSLTELEDVRCADRPRLAAWLSDKLRVSQITCLTACMSDSLCA